MEDLYLYTVTARHVWGPDPFMNAIRHVICSLDPFICHTPII